MAPPNHRYRVLRQHAARISKVAEYPMHVNGAYRDDPHAIPLLGKPAKTVRAGVNDGRHVGLDDGFRDGLSRLRHRL